MLRQLLRTLHLKLTKSREFAAHDFFDDFALHEYLVTPKLAELAVTLHAVPLSARAAYKQNLGRDWPTAYKMKRVAVPIQAHQRNMSYKDQDFFEGLERSELEELCRMGKIHPVEVVSRLFFMHPVTVRETLEAYGIEPKTEKKKRVIRDR